MNPLGKSFPEYDVVVVGSRVAGAATAMLLARRGHRVLLVDRRRPGSDTLSTLAMMRGAVLQLSRWGLLERVIDSGAPAVSRTIVHYADDAEVIDLATRAGIGSLYAPRRFVLDSILVDAAAQSGVDVRFGVRVDGVVRDCDGRVVGIRGRDDSGEVLEVRARFTVGADGRRSTVARSVGAEVEKKGEFASGVIYSYWSGITENQYDWFYRPGVAAGLLPTNGGETLVWAGCAHDRFELEMRAGVDTAFERLFAAAAPEALDRLAKGRRETGFSGFPGTPGFMRQPYGDGWALVGDASHFKDPISAHGITDALRDAEFLAIALDTALRSADSEVSALAGYKAVRDRLTMRLFETSERVASYRWDLTELRGLLIDLSRAMRDEVAALASLDDHRSVTAA
ncbi:MAG: NAD(P)/FAD-dependent oxidoreductase [Acidobacteriota bacterium]